MPPSVCPPSYRKPNGRRREAAYLAALALSMGLVGCEGVYVNVDCRLSRDTSLWRLLDGPRYVLHGPQASVEASLAFEEFADMWEQVLRQERPAMRRVPLDSPADLMMTLECNVYDLGTGVASYPVYDHYAFGYGLGCGRPYYRSAHYGYVGDRVETVHLGYARTLFISAWVPDAAQPARSRVIWEGSCDSTGPESSLKVAMPYLMAALGPYYGQATDKPDSVRLDRGDHQVKLLRRTVGPTTVPAH